MYLTGSTPVLSKKTRRSTTKKTGLFLRLFCVVEFFCIKAFARSTNITPATCQAYRRITHRTTFLHTILNLLDTRIV